MQPISNDADRRTARRSTLNRWQEIRELVERSPVPVFSLAEPLPRPTTIGGISLQAGVICGVTLSFGSFGHHQATRVLVATELSNASSLVLKSTLVKWQDAPPGASYPILGAERLVSVTVDSEPREAYLIEGTGAWALRLTLDLDEQPLVVSVISHGWNPTVVAFKQTHDLSRLVEIEIAKLTRSSDPVEKPAHPAEVATDACGIDAHIALVQDCVLRSRAMRNARQERMVFRPDMSGYSARWSSAIIAQMRLANQPRHEATNSVTSMVNQLLRLVHNASWFGNLELSNEAIWETATYTAFGKSASSQAAQESWRSWWQAQQSGEPLEASTLRDDGDLEAKWLMEWSKWAGAR